MEMPALYVLTPAVAAASAAAAGIDLYNRRVPNWLTVPVALGGFVFHVWQTSWAGAGFSALGFLVGFGVMLVLWLIGGGGAGDVKLMGALGAWMGMRGTIWVFLLAAALIVVYWIGWLLMQVVRTWLREGPQTRVRRSGAAQSAGITRTKLLVPFALPVALATWCVLLLYWWK